MDHDSTKRLSPTAVALFQHEMTKARLNLRKDRANYTTKLQAILTKETLVNRHQFFNDTPASHYNFMPVGMDDYGNNTSPTGQPIDWKQALEDLSRWMAPDAFREIVTALHSKCESRELFNNPRLSFLCDAWVLSEFAARQSGVDDMRMSAPRERWPDGFLRQNGVLRSIEVTTVLSEGRRLGEEYKSQLVEDSVEDWISKAEGLPGALELAIERKVQKKYSVPVELVVYLNINDYGVRQAYCRHVIRSLKSRYSSNFSALHVLWKDELL
jgi:hypothetical protein